MDKCLIRKYKSNEKILGQWYFGPNFVILLYLNLAMLRRLEALEVFDGRGARRVVRLQGVHSGEGSVPTGWSAEKERSAQGKGLRECFAETDLVVIISWYVKRKRGDLPDGRNIWTFPLNKWSPTYPITWPFSYAGNWLRPLTKSCPQPKYFGHCTECEHDIEFKIGEYSLTSCPYFSCRRATSCCWTCLWLARFTLYFLTRHSKRGRDLGRGTVRVMTFAMVVMVHDSALLFPIALGPPAADNVLDHVDARHPGRSQRCFRLRATISEGC